MTPKPIAVFLSRAVVWKQSAACCQIAIPTVYITPLSLGGLGSGSCPVSKMVGSRPRVQKLKYEAKYAKIRDRWANRIPRSISRLTLKDSLQLYDFQRLQQTNRRRAVLCKSDLKKYIPAGVSLSQVTVPRAWNMHSVVAFCLGCPGPEARFSWTFLSHWN